MKEKTIRYVPTDASLKIAAEVAAKLGFSIDAEKTGALALELHRTYFDEIIDLLEMDPKRFTFFQGSIRKVAAFADITRKGEKLIFFDEHFDFWLMTLTHLNTITTFKVLQPEGYEDIAALFELVLESMGTTDLHKTIRKKFKPYLLNHEKCLLFSHSFSKAMIAFILCHEIAHWNLAHFSEEKALRHEFEADEQALVYFKALIAKEENANHLKFDERFLAAPIVLMNYFSVYEKYAQAHLGIVPTREEHPDPIARSKQLWQATGFQDYPQGKECLKAFLAGLKDIVDELDPELLK
ncbi:MAG: hypothetical protein Mars2KO_05070 [Maribacter sp.]